MHVGEINNSLNFGIYKKTIKKPYGSLDIGEYKGKIFDIYSANDEKGELLHKLYYVKNKAEEWVMTKLKYFKNNKCQRIVRSYNFAVHHVGKDYDVIL